jgi:hypothetical protein
MKLFFFLLVKLMLADDSLGSCFEWMGNLDEQRNESFTIMVGSCIPAKFHKGVDEASVSLCVNLGKKINVKKIMTPQKPRGRAFGASPWFLSYLLISRRNNVRVHCGSFEKDTRQTVLVLDRLANAGRNGRSIHGERRRPCGGCGHTVGEGRGTHVNNVNDVGRAFQNEQLLVLANGLGRDAFSVDAHVLLRNIPVEGALSGRDNGANRLKVVRNGHQGVRLLAQIQIHIDVLCTRNLHTKSRSCTCQHAAHVALRHVIHVAKLVRLLKVRIDVSRRSSRTSPVLNAVHLARHMLAQILAGTLSSSNSH